MAITGPDDRSPYRELDVNVTSLEAWSAELHRLVGLTQGVNASVGHWSVGRFEGLGPPSALRLRDVNGEALATLAVAIEQLDGLITRLRDAASFVAASYSASDAYAKASTDSVRAGIRGEVPSAR